jgi:hypothetical protein
VIVFTGSADSETLARLHLTHVLLKPFSVDVLLDAISRLLRYQRCHRLSLRRPIAQGGPVRRAALAQGRRAPPRDHHRQAIRSRTGRATAPLRAVSAVSTVAPIMMTT